jgi:hypothetical protein
VLLLHRRQLDATGEDQSPAATHQFCECGPSRRHKFDSEQHPSANQHPAEQGKMREWISGATMLHSLTFWLIVVAVLITYLCVSVGLRLRAEEARRCARESQSPERAFDVSAIASQIRRVRHDYLEAAHGRSRYDFCRAGLLAAARRIVTSLSYFRRERHEHEV